MPEEQEASKPSFASRVMSSFASSLTDPQQWAEIGAEGRRGLKDLQDIAGQVWPSEANRSREELGTIGNPTPAEVDRQSYDEVTSKNTSKQPEPDMDR